MLPLAPILAQLLTLSAGDRTEARWLLQPGGDLTQAETRALLAIGVSWRHLSLSVGYSPDFTVSPLESFPHDVVQQHTVFAGGTVSGGTTRTSYAVSELVSVSRQNFLLQAVAAPTPVGGAPVPVGSGAGGSSQPVPDGGTGAPAAGAAGAGSQPQPGGAGGAAVLPATRGSVWFGTERTGGSITHAPSRLTTITGSAGYMVSGGLAADSRDSYPLVWGPDAGFSFAYQLSRRETATTAVVARANANSLHDHTQTLFAMEVLSHNFSRMTMASVGTGIAATRNEPAGAATLVSYDPVALANITSVVPWARGTLSSRAAITYAPIIDPISLRPDQRLSVDLGVSWTRDRFVISMTATGAFSLHPEAVGGINSLLGSLTASYDLGAGFRSEVGGREAWQVYSGGTTIPPTAVLFAALVWNGSVSSR